MTTIQDHWLTLADGNKMPQEGLGTYKLTDQAAMTQAIQAAYETGYRLIDTAQLYENETVLGNAIKSLGAPRDQYFITTKVAEKNQGYQTAIDSVKESLKKLQLDYVDLLLVHWPIQNHFFETWRAFEDMKKQGLTRSIGVSNFGIAHLELLATQANERPVVNQVERHPGLNQLALLNYHRNHGIVTQAWSPLARGKYQDTPVLKAIAEHHHKSVAQVILRWHLQGGVAIIPKSSHHERIQANADLYDFELSNAEMNQINQLNRFARTGREPELVFENNEQYQR
ncbi:aldo/keto reductase [Lactobacillus sp. 3B(2020)]|uniref:aldo/keto reductase n=1 Tax=Lactobacillus sp. 3B(2020) TaxID=2695882 RepID=UPI0015DE91B5|nr:aldo/keto reductase [Lactobacillus sp. 3B(2020)]QLL70680.1 aldo/keto reductase [Lactobacillus sp. 3B(2020)]